jgi:hypothetical protein
MQAAAAVWASHGAVAHQLLCALLVSSCLFCCQGNINNKRLCVKNCHIEFCFKSNSPVARSPRTVISVIGSWSNWRVSTKASQRSRAHGRQQRGMSQQGGAARHGSWAVTSTWACDLSWAVLQKQHSMHNFTCSSTHGDAAAVVHVPGCCHLLFDNIKLLVPAAPVLLFCRLPPRCRRKAATSGSQSSACR